MISWIKEGQKVVCLVAPDVWVTHSSSYWLSVAIHLPVEKGIYTIRGYGKDPTNGLIGLYLHEIHNPKAHFHMAGYVEPNFDHRGFKPLKSTETGMKILRGILDDSGRPRKSRSKTPTKSPESIPVLARPDGHGGDYRGLPRVSAWPVHCDRDQGAG